MKQAIKSLLYAALLGAKRQAALFSEEEEIRLIRLCQNYLIAGFVLKSNSLDPTNRVLLNSLRAQRKIASLKLMSMKQNLIEIAEKFNEQNIDFVVLKGLALAMRDIYKPGVRAARDIDLLVSKENILVGLITFRDITKHTTKPNANKDKFGRLRVAAAVGITNDVIDRVYALQSAGVDAIVVDTAHGHSKGVGDVVKKIKSKFSNLDLVVGNIATSEAAKYLVKIGADAVKVGIGPGSICTTRVIAGVGYPQLSAILEVKKALKGSDIPIIADGGIRYTGDIPKAIAAGADSVMLGSLLAGTRESPGETVIYEGRKFKTYRGMGSVESMKKGSKDRYFQDVEDDIKKLVPEGIVGRVPFKGDLNESIHQFIGGLRAGMGYCGVADIKSLKENAKFITITASGIKESHPHNINIIKEAPNYSPS